jgi:hypothetical protein
LKKKPSDVLGALEDENIKKGLTRWDLSEGNNHDHGRSGQTYGFHRGVTMGVMGPRSIA